MLYRILYDSLFFFFKQKTAYEMRISDWSSDVCSSDLTQMHPLRLGNMIDQLAIYRLAAPGAWLLGMRCAAGPRQMPDLFRDAVHVNQIGRASCRERVCQYV